MINTEPPELSPLETEAYHLVQHYIRHNKEFELQEIITCCQSELGSRYPAQSISDSVKSLLRKHYINPGTTLTREEIAENRVRKSILRYLAKNPGSYNRLIRRELKLGSNEFNWHIRMLERFGFIKKHRFNHSYGYYPDRSYLDHEYDLYLLQNDKIRQIIALLRRTPASISEIGSTLEMHYTTVQKYLGVLLGRDLIFQNPIAAGKKKQYRANEEILVKIQKIVNGQAFLEFGDIEPI